MDPEPVLPVDCLPLLTSPLWTDLGLPSLSLNLHSGLLFLKDVDSRDSNCQQHLEAEEET